MKNICARQSIVADLLSERANAYVPRPYEVFHFNKYVANGNLL